MVQYLSRQMNTSLKYIHIYIGEHYQTVNTPNNMHQYQEW